MGIIQLIANLHVFISINFCTNILVFTMSLFLVATSPSCQFDQNQSKFDVYITYPSMSLQLYICKIKFLDMVRRGQSYIRVRGQTFGKKKLYIVRFEPLDSSLEETCMLYKPLDSSLEKSCYIIIL